MHKHFPDIVKHLVRVGFFYHNSSIYNGLANAWDYAPLGATLKRNLKTQLYDFFIHKPPDVVEIDTNVILQPTVWTASGHARQFFDNYVTCRRCNSNFKQEQLAANGRCLKCGASQLLPPRAFNLLFQTRYGLQSTATHFLRPETSQGIFINFANILRTTRLKLPLGVGQFGKSFRNEITPRHMIFRTREFEQLELVYFVPPVTAQQHFNAALAQIESFLQKIGITRQHYRVFHHPKAALAHYARATCDINFHFPFGWRELWGLSDRGDYDLRHHQQYSGVNLTYFDPATGNRFFPVAIEPSVGVDRLVLAVLCQAFRVETLPDDSQRVVLNLPASLAPFQIMMTALAAKLHATATQLIFTPLQQQTTFRLYYDHHGSIGKKYRRADAIGVLYCVTYDYDSPHDHMVTVRERTKMTQQRVKIKDLAAFFHQHFRS